MKAPHRKNTTRRVSGRGTGERQLASLYASYYAEISWIEWVALRDTIRVIARELNVPTSGLSRSQIALACMREIQRLGYRLPEGYIPHWERVSNMMILKRHPHRTGRRSAHPGR